MKNVDFMGFSEGYAWVRIPPSPLFEKACKTAANVDFTGFFDVFHMVKNAEIS